MVLRAHRNTEVLPGEPDIEKRRAWLTFVIVGGGAKCSRTPSGRVVVEPGLSLPARAECRVRKFCRIQDLEEDQTARTLEIGFPSTGSEKEVRPARLILPRVPLPGGAVESHPRPSAC